MNTFHPHTDDELKQIAIDLFEGRIFTDRHLKSMEDARMVFMLIPLGAFAEAPPEYIDNIGMIYEYLSEAGPRSVNGYPSFLSLRVLSKEQTEKMLNFYDEYIKLKESFIQKPAGV
jgi:hypothetical protein